MPITWQWYDDAHEILLLTFDQHWTWDELYQVQEETRAERTLDTVYIIADYTAVLVAPTGISHAVKALRRSEVGKEYLIFVNAPYAIEQVLQFAKQMIRHVVSMPFDFADSLDEALVMIEQQRQNNNN